MDSAAAVEATDAEFDRETGGNVPAVDERNADDAVPVFT
jgi:hypothetical protein